MPYSGLYQPSEGTVRIFGRAPESIPEEERRKVFGLVEQQFKPVSGNMRDQITLSDPSISEEDVRRALAETGILPAIEDLPEGLDTPYDPGLLSQGQFQLLSIARATVTNPPLLKSAPFSPFPTASSKPQVAGRSASVIDS